MDHKSHAPKCSELPEPFIQSLFAGMTPGSAAPQKLPYLISGYAYVVEITGLTLTLTRAQRHVVAVRAVIRRSECAKRPIGSACIAFANLPSGRLDTPEVRSLIAALEGWPPTTSIIGSTALDGRAWATVLSAAVDAHQPYRGRTVAVYVEGVVQRNGRVFTRHHWAPLAPPITP